MVAIFNIDCNFNASYSCGGLCKRLDGCAKCYINRNCHPMYEIKMGACYVSGVQFFRRCSYECGEQFRYCYNCKYSELR